MKDRLDRELVVRRLIETRSQAEQEIEFGNVAVNGKIITKVSYLVSSSDKIRLISKNPYVSRAGLKLASVSEKLRLNFKNKIVLDVGSSTGGFTDFALQHGAKKVIAVDVGSNQLHEKLRSNLKVELHEQTDIRDFRFENKDFRVDLVLIDVSFISLKQILPHISNLIPNNSQVIAMAKPQFEGVASQLNDGVVKNARIRSDILQSLEVWLKGNGFVVVSKSDSSVAGEKGNLERFYLLKATR